MGNQISVFSSGNAGAFAGIYAQVRYSLFGCAASLKVPDSPKIPGITAFFMLSSNLDDADQIAFT